MSPLTVQTAFDPEALPPWAREHEAVLWLCRRDLGYRCSVCADAAKNAQWQHFLVYQAVRREAIERDR